MTKSAEPIISLLCIKRPTKWVFHLTCPNVSHSLGAFDLHNVSQRDMKSASDINGCLCNETTKLFFFYMEESSWLILLVAYCSGIELKVYQSVFPFIMTLSFTFKRNRTPKYFSFSLWSGTIWKLASFIRHLPLWFALQWHEYDLFLCGLGTTISGGVPQFKHTFAACKNCQSKTFKQKQIINKCEEI